MTNSRMIIAASAIAFFAASAPFAFAQSTDSNNANTNGPSATSSLKGAGHSAENTASNTYDAAKTAVKDTTITSRVKMALHEDKVTHGAGITVDTTAGVVTLSGTAPTKEAAHRAVAVAKKIRGVQSVKDAITVTNRG
jgi:hyperosmotically inducible periplasmic protein